MTAVGGAPRTIRSGHAAVLAYGLAALAGALLVARIFPASALDGTMTLVHPVTGDPAQHIVGQRYFLADTWRWPPLLTRLIEPPGGVSIALTDSIPLESIAAKPFAEWLPHGGHLIYAWVALCYVLQPLAAVFALRAAGARGVLAPVAGGILAVCMPALIFRFAHAALSAHFTLLLAIGVYFRLVAAPRSWWWVGGVALLIAALLIHPYLMAMVAGLLAAAPLSLLVRRQAGLAGRVAIRLLAGIAVLGGVAALGGYLGADSATGFGYYSLNLLSPFTPSGSALIGGFVQPDATGGQFEGYSYLGLGLAALVLVALVQLRTRAARGWVGGHAGLWIVALGAALYAVSDTVYAGHHLLFHLPLAPTVLRQFRASGRFVWVDLYVLLVAAAMLTGLGLGWRRATFVLLAAAALQYADTRALRGQVAGQLRRPAEWAVDPALYRPLLAAHQRLTLWPTAACNPELVANPVFMHLLLLASETALPVDTIPTARTTAGPGCDPAALTRPTLLPGELRLLLPGLSPNLVTALPGLHDRCHALPGGLVGCTATAALDNAPIVGTAPFALDHTLSLGDRSGGQLRGLGWTDASADGAWTIGPEATLLGSLPPGPGPLHLTVVAHGLARPGQAQAVRVRANGADVAIWQVTQGADATYQADLPAGVAADGRLVLSLDIADPVRPADVLGNGDTRPVGLFLRSFRLDTP